MCSPVFAKDSQIKDVKWHSVVPQEMIEQTKVWYAYGANISDEKPYAVNIGYGSRRMHCLGQYISSELLKAQSPWHC